MNKNIEFEQKMYNKYIFVYQKENSIYITLNLIYT